MLQRQLSRLNGRKFGHRQVEASCTFYAWRHPVLYWEHDHSHDFCLLPAQFCYMIVFIRKVESRVKIADQCAPWIISVVRINFFRGLQFEEVGVCR
jgi:hypothetical protein